MHGEMVITENDLRNRFQGERDLVTYAPYRVGDRVVRCSSCRAVIKTEFISTGCPLCGHTPFLPSPVVSVSVNTAANGSQRKLTTFLWLLILSAALALLPFASPAATAFVYKATFELGFGYSLICTGAVSFITAIIIYNNRKSRRMWQNAEGGGLLLLIPASAPYLILAAIWAVLFVIAIIIAITGFVFVIAIIIGMLE